ncbi:hypothetical protein EMPS_03370 [Entomortierella parvispora]|uniref:CASTOR ACT domain-containing protein n=1 Tax=Entomortierella parvispora TaxID=205924 RepID=A0A9P3LUT9_9FUNG|nr:hypothetical protein EMPS_03370 [Entomortierella parvispora]
MTVSLLPDRLRLLRFPREDLELCSHAILKHILFRDYSHSHRDRQEEEEPLFSYIDNSLEISIFGDAEALVKDFPKDLCPGLEISASIYRALQVDNDDTFNSSRICTIVEPLAKAGVSVFYMSTYQTDLLFVQESRLPVVFTTLSSHGLHVAQDEEEISTPPDTPIPDQVRFKKNASHEEDPSECQQHREQALHQHQDRVHNTAHHKDRFTELALMTPPESMDSSGDEGHMAGLGEVIISHHAVKQLVPLDIFAAQRRRQGSETRPLVSQGKMDDYDDNKPSPTTTTAFELRQQAVRTLPENYLRCVGLNTDLEGGHQPWILKIIKILFYNDKVKEEAVTSGRGPSHDAPRFFSFTATSECVSMITDTYILDEFEEHELFMDMDTCPLRLIQLDLHRFGLDKFGIIHSVARPLTEAGIELLYLSTFSTANILVAEHRLSDAERILSGSGANTPHEDKAPSYFDHDGNEADHEI